MEQIIYIKMDLALNNLQKLICHKTKQTKPNLTFKNEISKNMNVTPKNMLVIKSYLIDNQESCIILDVYSHPS